MDLGGQSPTFFLSSQCRGEPPEGGGASSGGQPGVSSGARSVGKLNFRSAASAALSTETFFSRRRVAPKDSARSLSGFDSPRRRNLSLVISVCTSRLVSRGSHPVATSKAAVGVLLSLPVNSLMAAFWILSSFPRLVLLTRLRIGFAYSRADLTKVTYRVLSDDKVAPQLVPASFFISPILTANCSTWAVRFNRESSATHKYRGSGSRWRHLSSIFNSGSRASTSRLFE